jgi:hypothetical protein
VDQIPEILRQQRRRSCLFLYQLELARNVDELLQIPTKRLVLTVRRQDTSSHNSRHCCRQPTLFCGVLRSPKKQRLDCRPREHGSRLPLSIIQSLIARAHVLPDTSAQSDIREKGQLGSARRGKFIWALSEDVPNERDGIELVDLKRLPIC